MKTNELLRLIADSLVYNQHYANHYPEEDKTSLEEEFLKLIRMLNGAMEATRRSAKVQWLELALREVELALNFYRTDDDENGWRAMDASLDYLKCAQTNKAANRKDCANR